MFEVGDKLRMRSWHQRFRPFRSKETTAEVIEVISDNAMKVRVSGDLWNEPSEPRELKKITDDMWLEMIGLKAPEGTHSYLPPRSPNT